MTNRIPIKDLITGAVATYESLLHIMNVCNKDPLGPPISGQANGSCTSGGGG